MKRLLVIAGLAVFASIGAGSAGHTQDWDARRMAEQAAQEAMARALAETARNDEIVRQQQMERERQRVEQEQRMHGLEEAERRSRTG